MQTCGLLLLIMEKERDFFSKRACHVAGGEKAALSWGAGGGARGGRLGERHRDRERARVPETGNMTILGKREKGCSRSARKEMEPETPVE